MTVEATRPFLLIYAPAAHAEHASMLVMGWPSNLLNRWWIPNFPLRTLLDAMFNASTPGVKNPDTNNYGYYFLYKVAQTIGRAALFQNPSPVTSDSKAFAAVHAAHGAARAGGRRRLELGQARGTRTHEHTNTI